MSAVVFGIIFKCDSTASREANGQGIAKHKQYNTNIKIVREAQHVGPRPRTTTHILAGPKGAGGRQLFENNNKGKFTQFEEYIPILQKSIMLN